MINQPESETIDSSMTPPSKDVLSYSVSQNPVASELDGDSIDSSIQNALTETASNQSKKTSISIPVQELTPIEKAVNEYAKINNARNKTALNQSLVSASAKDPDTAAKSQALATSLNVSTGVVDFDIELAKRQMLLRKAEAMKLAEKYPSLARSFLNQDFAEVAHDDIDNLAKTSDISRRLIATEKSPSDSLPLEFDPIRTANYYATNTLEGFKSDWERGYKSGDITDRSSKLGYSAFTSPGSELRDAYIFQAENLKSKTEEYLGTWTESLAELAGQMAPMTVEAAATGVVASGGAALAASIFPPAELPLVPGAFAAGFAGSMSYQSYEIETGASYLDLRKGDEDYEPMSHEEAAAIAPTVGLINAVLETASNLFFFIPGAKLANYALKKTVKETVSKSLRKATVGKLARSAAVRVLKTGTLETVTEVLQTIVSKIVQEANVPEGRMSAFDTEEGRKRFADEIAVTIEKTFKGAFLLGLIPGGAKFIHERSILNESIEQQNDITNHIDNAKESKVNKRSKTTYASYLAEQLSGESLHIGVEQFEQARRKNGVGLQEVEKIIPGITEQVAKAKASGGDVVIPTSLYLSELIDTEFGVSIRNDIRADAEGMSINDIAESQEFLKELKSINKQAIEDFKETNKDWAESAGKIEEEVFAKIKAAGNYTEEQARMLAQFHRDIAVVLASRFEMTPEQFNAKFGLSIESAYTPEQQAPAQQVAPALSAVASDKLKAKALEMGISESQISETETLASSIADNDWVGIDDITIGTTEDFRNHRTAQLDLKTIEKHKDKTNIDIDRGTTLTRAMSTSVDKRITTKSLEKTLEEIHLVDEEFRNDVGVLFVSIGLGSKGRLRISLNQQRLSETQIREELSRRKAQQAPAQGSFEQAAVRQTPMPSVTTTNPVSPIGLAIASIPANGPKSIADSNTFFKKVWKKLLIATGKQIRSKSDDSVKAAAKLAVADIQDFLKGNTQFLDYYSQDWIKTKQLLDNYAGRPITNDEFQMYRIISGLTSPNTKLPSNISDTVKLWTHWMNKGSFDDFLLGSKPITGTSVVFESAESVSGTTANVKIRTIKIVADLTKKLGSVKAAIDYLREPVTVKELHAVNKTLGYAGNVSNIGNIRSLVQMATGQDTLIPRMFIFGQKVGAYALNSIGDERFTTVDIWESRYIRSFFSGMFENEIGLPVDEKEHDTFVRFGYAFKDEMERVTGRTWTPSSLQALRWFYIIAATRAAGYSKASTSETISTYTNRVLQSTFDYDQSRETNATKSITTPPRRIEPKKYERDIDRDLDAKGITDPKQRQRITQGSWIQFTRSNRVGDEVGFQFDTNRSGVYGRSGTLSGLATVATHTPGVRLVDALAKAGVSTQPYVELEPTAEGVKTFSDLVRKVNANSKFGTAVYVYSDADYAKKRLFISESGKSGFALSSDGDIVSVFSESGSREGRGAMILATQMGGTKLDCFDTILPGYYAAHGFRAVARVPWNDEFIPAGWDFNAFGQYNGGRPDVVYMVYEEKYSKPYSNTDGVVVSNPDEAVAIQTKDIKTEADRAATSKARYAQLVRPPSTEFAQSAQNKPARGFFNPKQLKMMLGSKSDFTTFIHELAHYNLTVLGRIASNPQSPSQIREDMDTTLSWFGIAGETPEQRLANWNAMTLEEQRPHHETFAYNHEIYLSEGKSPSIEMQGVFERFGQFIKRIYISIRDDLNAIYKQEFGTDLPMMTGEIRRVMDRMIATDEQIRSAEERRNMENIFKDQELSGMDDAQWASYQQMRAEATQKSVSELNEQSLAATTWASRLKAKKVKELEAEQEELRSEIRKQVKKEVESRNVYRAIKFLKYGILQTAGGEEVEFTGSNKLNTNAVKLMVPKENMDKFGSGKNGMVALDGYHPDIVSEMFNYSSGDELILAILDAKPMDEVIDGITEDRMEIENGELNSPQAIEAAADKAVHNEARVKLVAVELRWLTKATQPVRAMIAAAKSVAKQMLETKRLRDIKPGDYASAAARAAKESQTAYFASQSAETTAKTAYTRHYNKMIAEGVEEAKAVEMATKVSDEALAKAESRSEAHKKKYGKMKPSEIAAQAKRSQLLQEQLALEAKEVKDEIKSQIKKFKRFFENDKKIAKTRNMDLVNAARSILAFYGLGKHNKLPSAYLEQLKEYNPNLFETVFAMVTRAQIGTPDYQSLTVEEFRSMKETVDALWELANRENQIRVEGEVVLVNQAVDELNARIDEIGVPTKIAGETQAVTGKDRLVRHINSTKAILRRVQNWADATDGANNVVGPFTKYIWRPISQALNAYRIDRNKYVKRYVELLKEIALPVGKIVAPELNYTFGADNGGIGIAELLGAIMHSGNISNLEKLLIGRKWATVSEDGTMDTSRWYAFVARVTNDGTLTKQHFDFIQATWDLNEELKPMAQKAHHDIEGYYFKEVEATPFTNQFGTYRGGYVPAKTDPFIVRDAQRQAKMSELESDFRAAMPSTGAGFTESRVKYNKPLSLDIRLIAKHIDDVIRYSHVQPAVKDVMRILNKRSFADKLTRMDSMAIDEMIIPWLNRSARQITSDPGRSKWVDNFWRTIRSRTGMAIMIGNIRNALQQPTGLFMSATKVKPSNLGNAFLAYLSSPHKTAQEVSSLSSFMSNKLENQIFDLQNAMNELLLNPNAYKKIERWTLHHAYFLQSAFQNMADIVTWVGAYNQYLEESGVGVSNADAQKEAVNRADAAVQLTQGTRNPESIAAFEVGTPFYQTFIQFTGYYSMLANLNTDEYVKIFRDLGWRGNKGKLVYTFLMGFAAQAIVSDAIVRTLGGDWEDDDDDGYLDVVMDWIFGSMARSAVAMVPFGSSAYTALTTAYNNKPYDDRITSSPSISALESSTVGVGKAIINVVSEDKEITGQNVKDVATLISVSTGIPMTLLGRPASYLVDVERGAVEPTSTTDLVRGLITGTASKESKK